MKRELIDICQPIQIVTEERRKLEAAGYILIDQHGGGDLYSSLVYADYANATEDERKEIMRMMASNPFRNASKNWQRKIFKLPMNALLTSAPTSKSPKTILQVWKRL